MRLNRVVLTMIEGPGHRLLPAGVTEISYRGPVSGSAVRLPVQSVVDGSRFLVVAGRPERKRWWRAFRHAHPARVVRDGARYDVVGHVLTGPPRSRAVATYLSAHPASRRGLGASTPVIAFDRVESW